MVLRAATGATLVAQGLMCLLWRSHATAALLAAGVLVVITGLFVLLGFLTPIASLVGVLECVSVAFLGISLPGSLLDSKLIVLQVTAGLVAIAFLGPGAFSLDARLFGWKEIVIPAAPHKPE